MVDTVNQNLTQFLTLRGVILLLFTVYVTNIVFSIPFKKETSGNNKCSGLILMKKTARDHFREICI